MTAKPASIWNKLIISCRQIVPGSSIPIKKKVTDVNTPTTNKTKKKEVMKIEIKRLKLK